MPKEKDKKTLIILLAILGLACIFSAFWLYNSFKTESFSDVSDDFQGDLELARVMKLKAVALDNIEDFLKLEGFGPESIWENFYQDERYQELKELEVQINTQDGIGNPYPFSATSTSSENEDLPKGEFFGF